MSHAGSSSAPDAREQRTGHGDHVVHVVSLGQAGAEEDAAQVDVVGDITTAQVADLYPQAAVQDSTAMAAFFWPMPGNA